MRHLLPTLLLALTAASCVSQQKYDEALATAQMYQLSAHDNAEYIEELQAQNEALRGQLADYSASVVPAAAYTDDIDERLASLQSMLRGMGQSVDAVSMFEVEGGYGYSMSDAVLFASGSAELSADGRRLLVEMARTIPADSYERIWIRGHTDADKVSRPETLKRFPAGNIELSADRALSVAVLLSKEGGLPMQHLAVAGLGASRPVADNATAEGKAKNRRVEIFIIERGGATAESR